MTQNVDGDTPLPTAVAGVAGSTGPSEASTAAPGDSAVPGDTVAPGDTAEPGDTPAPDGELPGGRTLRASSTPAQLEREGDVAADYLEGLLDIADLDGDIDIDVEGERATVSIVGARLDQLVGADGQVLEALQEITRLAVQQSLGVRSRLMLDVSGFRAQRRADLRALTSQVAHEVLTSGTPKTLDPMSPFERKVVHDAVATVDGVMSESEGEEPRRCVVIRPA